MKPRSPFQLVRKGSRNLAIAIFSLIAANAASATSATWTGANNALWSAPGSWIGSPATVPGTGDTATFSGAGTITVDLTGGVTIKSILFDTVTAGAYMIGTGPTQALTLNNGGDITLNAGVNNTQTFNAGIVLGTDGTTQTFNFTSNNTFATAKTLTFASTGTITGSTGAGVKTLDVNATGVGNFIGVSIISNISDGTTGTVKLVKDGDGSMQIGYSGGTMNYSGGTYLNAGTLYIVGNSNNLKAGSSLFIAGGTSLGSTNQSGGNYTNIVQEWNGDFSFNDSTRGNGSMQQMTFNGGTVNLGTTGTDTVRTINALANTLTLNSIISNGTNGTTTGLTKTGAGTMVLGGINTYTGATTVNAGTLTITNTSTGSGAFTVNGGTLTLSGTSGSITNSSAITLAGGTVQLYNTTTAEGSVNRLSNSTAISSNGGTLTYNNSDATFTYAENVGNVTLNGGQLNTVLSTNMTSGKQTLTFNSLTQNNRSTATFSQGTALNATTNLIKVAGATATATGGIIGPWATTGTSAIVQTDYAVYDATGNIVAANIAGSADSTWTDSTKAYTSNFLGGGAANVLSAVTHNMAALRNLPAFGNANTATTIVIPSGGNLNTYGLLNANQGLWTINQITGSTGALSTPSGGGNLYINTGNGTAAGNGAITINAPINDNGAAVSIVKTGTGNTVAVGQGVLTLSNVTSNYSGATVINGGAIVLNTTGALANGGVASSLGAASTDAANLVLNGGFLQYSGAGATSTNRLFSVGAMGGTIDSTGATTATMSFIGTGAMGFASQTGPRTLMLQGSNVGVAASTSGSNSSLSTLALLIGDNSGATSLTKAGSGTWALTNPASTYTGPTTITAGILNVGTFAGVNTASSLGKGSVAGSAADLILNGGILQYSNNASNTTTTAASTSSTALAVADGTKFSLGQLIVGVGIPNGTTVSAISGNNLTLSQAATVANNALVYGTATTNRLFSIGTSNGTLDSSAASPTNTLSFTATGAMGFNNTVGARTLTLQGTNTGANSLGLLLGDYGGLTNLTKSSTGTWALGNAANTYTGVTTINGGILSVGKLANGGVASSIGASTNAATNLVFNSTNSGAQTTIAGLVNAIIPNTGSNAPILKYTGSGDSTDRLINFTNSAASRFAVIDASGGAALNFTNTGSPTFTTTNQKFTLVLAGSNTNDNTFAGVIPNNGTFGVSVVKIGTGTWILSGNNTYSDAGTAGDFGTLVNQGTLVLSGSPTAATALKTTVNAGGTLKLDYTTNNTSKLSDHATLGILTLAGGTLNLSGGSHVEVVGLTTISPGASSVIQTNSGTSKLRMNAITRNAGGMVDFGVASIASTTTANTAAGILGAYATIGGADWAIKSGTVENGSNNYITALPGASYTDIDALGSTIVSGTNTNVRLNSSSGSGNIAMAAGTTTINTLLQNTSTAATVDTSSAKILQTTGIMIGTGKEALTIGAAVGDGQLQAASSGGDLVLSNFNSSKILTINAPITANGTSTLTTSGNVTLNGVNTYTGATYVDSGTLEIAGASKLGSSGTYSGAIAIASGATLKFTTNQNQTLTGSTLSGLGSLTWSGTGILNIGAGRTATSPILNITNGGSLTASTASDLGTGPASDLILDGGILRPGEPSGGNTSSTSRLFTLGTGGATIQPLNIDQSTNSRRLEFTSTGPIAFTGSGNRTLKFESGVMLGARFAPAIGDGTGGVTNVVMGGTVGANGIWTLEGANTYTGTTTVNGGSLVIRKQQSVNGGVAYFTPTNVAVVSGAGIAVGVGAAPTYFDASAIATILDSSHLGGSTASTGLNTGAQFGMDTTAGDFTYSTALAELSGGNVLNLAKHGIGTLTLSGNNTYTGTTTIYGDIGTSTLRAGSATAFGQPTTASIAFGYSSIYNTQKLQLFGNNVTLIGLNSTVANWRDGGGVRYIESGSSDTSGTGIDVLTVNTPVSTTSTWNNINSTNGGVNMIQDGGARKLGITKGGDGTLEIGTTVGGASNFNTYTGGTIINAGILRALSTGVFGGAGGTGGTLTFGSGSTGTVQLNGKNNTIVGLNTNATVGTPIVEAGATSATLTLNPLTGTTSTFAGVLRNNSGSGGTLSLTFGGPGTLTLSGDNTYTGNTSVTGGKLILSGNNVNAITGATTVSGGVIQYNSLAAINGTALNNVTVNAPGAMVFGAALSDADIVTGLGRVANGSTGAIAADNNAAGAFNFTNLTAASLGAVGTVNYTGTLTPNGTTYRLGGGGGTLTYGAAISGSALAITGASTGSVVLSNNSNALGALTVSSGVLDLNATTGQTAGAVTLAGGTVQNGTLTGTSYSGTGGTSTAVLAGNSIVFTQTSGTTTLNATNTYGGGTTISGGTLKAVAAGSLGTNTVTLNGGNLSLASDGTGTGLGNSKLESISYGNAVTVSANQSITVGQFTAAVGTLNAANKTLQLGALGIGANTLTVTNNNGFGLEFTDTTTLSGIATFSVANPTLALGNAPIVQGLTLSGKLTGLYGIVKSGTGTLVLSNATNDFGIVAGGSLIDVTNGLVSISADAQLGQALNQVSLHASGSGLQLNPDGTGSFAHQINTTTAGGVIDVTQFGATAPTTTNVATLTTAFNGGAASANAFSKTGNGILEINVANNGATPYTGVITVSAGAIRVSNAGALGAAANNTIVSGAVGSAVQINGVSTAELFNLTGSGINSGGALQAVGSNISSTASGAISLGGAATIGADVTPTSTTTALSTASTTLTVADGTKFLANEIITGVGIPVGTTISSISGNDLTLSQAATVANGATVSVVNVLNLTGGIANAQALTFSGAGNINVSNAAIGAVSSITKIGSGTTTLSVASTSFILPFAVNAGTFKLDGAAKFGNASTTTVNPGAILTLDNTGTSTASRLGGSTRTLALSGGTLKFIGNSTTEAIGALTPSAGLDVINLSGTGTLSFASLGTRAAGGVVSFTGSGPAVQFVAATTITDGILCLASGATGSAAYFYGNDFATSTGAANAPISAYAGYTTGNFGAQATSTTINFNPTGGAQTNVTASKTINTLKLTGDGVTINPGQILTLDAAALINNGGGNITGGYLITASNAELVINNASTMSIGSVIGSSNSNITAALTKVGAGNLTLSALDNYTGTTTVNQGTLTLGSGSDNTLAVGKAMVVNNGGTLALGSNNQYVGLLTSTGTVEDSGGTITGTGVTLTTNATNGTFAGNISGSINLVKAGANTMILSSAQSTTGTIAVIGGGLTLKDGGTLLGTTGGITINGATLTIDNTGTKDLADRVNGSAITLNSGAITYNGRAQFNSTESLGAVTANSGLSTINVVAGGTGVNSAQLTLASLTRSTGAALVFNTNAATLGQIGNSPRLVVNGGLTGNLVPVNGVVPGVFDFMGANQPRVVGYVPGLGFGEIGTPGFAKFVKILGTTGSDFAVVNGDSSIPAYVPQASDNVMFVGGGNPPAAGWLLTRGTTTINSINISAENSPDQVGAITFSSPTNILKLQSGNFTMGSSSTNPVIGTVASRGVLTSGQSELFILATKTGATYLTFHSVIADNGANPVSAVFSGAAPTATTVLTAPNTYTGGTYVNGGTLNLTATDPGTVVIPYSSANSDAGAHGLVITNATVTQSSAAAQQIDPRNTVTLNGSSVLTLTGNNTLANIVFNSNGGTGSPGVASGNILTVTGNITSTPTNVGLTAVPTISGTLDLNNTSHNITVDGGPTYASVASATAGSGTATVGNLTITGGGLASPVAVALLGTDTAATAATKAQTALDTAAGVGKFTVTQAAGTITITANTIGTSAVTATAGNSGIATATGFATTGTTGLATNPLFNSQGGAAVTGLTISSIINSTTPASGSLTKLGTGVLELSGVNVFTGGLNVNAGAVKASTSGNSIGGSGNLVTLNNNAGLWLNTTVNGGQTIVVSSSGGTLASLGNNTLADNITLNGPLAISLADPTLNNTDRSITIGTTNTITGTGGLTVTGNVNNPFNLVPRSLFLTNGTSQTNTFSGGLTIGSGGRVTPSAAYNIGSLTGTLTVNTGGVLDMNATSQTVGNFTGTGGTITSTGTTVFTIGFGSVATTGNFAGVIATGTTGSLVKTGTGTIALSGSNTYTGGTTVANGTLALDFTTATTAAPVLATGGVLTLAGGTVDLRSGTAQVQAVASTTLTGGLSGVTRSSGTSVLRMGTITPGSGIVNFGAGSIASATNANNGAGILGGWATLGSTWAVNSGTLEGGGNNYITAFTGTFTDVDRLGGTITSAATSNVQIIEAGVGTEVTPAAAGTTDIATLLVASDTTGTATYNPDTADILRLGAAGGILVPSTAGALTIGSTAGDGHLTAGGAPATAGTIAITNNHATNLVTVNSIIENNGVSVVGLATAGNVLLNGVNTYSGNTGIGNGTLEIGGAGQLGAGSYAGTIQIGGGGTLKYNSSADQTLTGAITGFGGLLKDGAGTLTFGQATYSNTYSGNTVINNGILSVGAAEGNLRGSVTINAGGTLKFASLGYAGPATTVSTININGGTLDSTATNNNTFTGVTVNMTGGVWSHSGTTGITDLFQNAGYTTSGALNTLASSTTAVVSAKLQLRSSTYPITVATGTTPSGVDLEISTPIFAGSGNGIVKAGAGLLAITANNSVTVAGSNFWDSIARIGYDGTTTINAGTLQLGNNTTTGNLNPASAIVDNATLAFNRSNTLTQGTDFNSVISGTGAVDQNGSGTTLLNGTNTYSGTTNVTGGTLVVSGSGSINSSSGITVNGSTAAFMQNSSVPNSRSITLTQGTLGGTGTLTSAITSASGVTLAPGDRTLVTPAKGTLTVQNALNLSGGTTNIRLFSDTANDSDKLVQSTTGTITFGGTLNVSEASNFSGTYAIGNSWDLFDWTGTATGAFSSTSLPSLSSLPGSTWDTSSLYTNGVISIASTGGASPTPAISIASSKSRFLTGVTTTGVITGNVTNTGSLGYSYTSIVNNGTGTLSSIAPQSAIVAATSGSQAYTASIDGSGAAAGTSYTFGTTVTDGTTPASSSTVSLTAVNQRTFTAGALSLGRVLTGSSLSSVAFTTAVSTSGAQATTTDATLNSFSAGSLSGISSPSFSGSGIFDDAADTVSGSLSGTVTGTPGSISGSLSASIADELAGTSTVTGLVTVTGTAVADRAASSIAVDLGDIGRRLAGSNLSLTGQTLSFSSTGSNSTLTDVTIGGTTYDGTTTTGTLASQSAGITGVAGSGTATISVAPANAETNFSYTPATLTSASYTATAVNQRTFTSPSNIALGRVLLSTAVPTGQSADVTSTGQSQATTADSTLAAYAGSAINGLSLSGGPTLFDGTTTSATYTLTGTLSGTAGSAVGGSFGLNATDEFSNALTNVASVSFTGTAVGVRTVTAPGSTDLGTYHAGAAVSVTSNNTGGTYGGGTGVHADTEDATLSYSGTADANGINLNTGDTTLSTATGTRSFTGTAAVSSAGGSFSVGVSRELSGAASSINVDYTIAVYSGDMVWGGTTGATWGTNSNWSDATSGGAQVAPGLDAGYAGSDIATFGATSGSVTVNLGSAAPSVNQVVFNGTGSYTLAQGGSNSLTLAGGSAKISSAGTQAISAPVILANNTEVAVSSDTLSISGAISGSGSSLSKTGGGILELANASGNSYDGGTSVTGGTLLVNNTSGSGVGSGALSVGSSAKLGGSGIIGAATTIAGIHAPGNSGAGIQTFSNGLQYTATSHLEWELNANGTSNRGTAYDGVDVTGGSFVITSGATLDLGFAGTVDFANSFWNSTRSWTVADLGSGLIDDGGSDLFTLASYTGPNYTIAQGSFSVSRVADANSKNDVVLTWQSPYDIWAVAKGLTGSNNGLEQNPDGDAYTNLIEYAFDTNPNSNASGPGPITYNSGTSTITHGQPTVSVVKTGSTVDASAIFGRRKDYAEAGLTYTVMFSADMSTWEDSVATPDILHSDATLDMVKVPYPLFLSSGKKAAFFKVEVTKN